VGRPAGDWQLAGFLERLDAWTQAESPEDDLRLLVTAWVMTRYDDPYRGVRREVGMDNLWFGVVPDSDDGAGHVVVCSYFVNERGRIVVCSGIASLTLPL